MNTLSKNNYQFDGFTFDAERLALYHENHLIGGVGEKSLQVLSVLLQNPKKLTAHNEIIERVWRDNPSGVTPVHVAQYISKLRKFLPNTNLAKNISKTPKVAATRLSAMSKRKRAKRRLKRVS